MARKSKLSRRVTWAVAILCLVAAGGTGLLSGCSTFGGAVTGERLKRAEASPHFGDGRFFNTVRQSPDNFGLYWDYLTEQFGGDQIRVPSAPIPVVAIPPGALDRSPLPGLRLVWLGHASVYLEVDGLRLLVDPVFSEYASPLQGIGPRRFHAPPIALADLPKIDAVMISHDHYDHLVMATIQHLAAKGTRIFVPLGVGAHLTEWGVPESQVVELDWWQERKIGALKIICTPSRHYSGRDLFDRKATFWSSWSILGPRHRVYYSGDTGFSGHFQDIGDRLGPFDLSIIKIGAYGPGAPWIDIHMPPEDSIRAHQALRARRLLPVHWATFNMAFHAWDEPIIRTVKAARDNHVTLLTPRVGQIIDVGATNATDAWWEAVKLGPVTDTNGP